MGKQPDYQTENTAQRLKAIFNTVIDGIIIIDHKGIIDALNPAAADLFGYDANELEGQNVSILMPTPHRTNHDSYLQNYLQGGEAKIIGIGREVEGQRKDGSIFPMRLAVGEFLKENGNRMFTGVIHDLTEVKEAEQSLRELNQNLEKLVEGRTRKLEEVINKLLEINKKYEKEISHRKKAETTLRDNEIRLRDMLSREKELNELKSRFVSMASHEFKTPLSTILSSASLISRYAQDHFLEKREKHVQRIKNSVQHLDAILNDFLSLSKLEEGKIEVAIGEFTYDELLEEINNELGDNLKEAQSIIHENQLEEQTIGSDKRILKNILFNLISNASKYSPEGSRIFCKTGRNEDEYFIQIRDEGIGIPEEDQKHLFTRFFRASNAMNIKGTGLGLYIVQRYLDSLDGRILFESQEGKGSTFTIYLNANAQQNAKNISH